VPYEYEYGYANTNMAMVAQPPEQQIVSYGYEYGRYGYPGYDVYQYVYPQLYSYTPLDITIQDTLIDTTL
jgi:hypothetical protein